MIEESATVLRVEADKIIVQSQRQSACSTCGVNKGCGTATIAKAVGNKRAVLEIPRNTSEQGDLQPGDEVLLGIDETTLLGNSALAYISPLVAFFLFAITAQQLGPVFGLEGEGFVIVASVLGLLISLYLVKQHLQHHHTASIRPVILRKIQHVTVVRGNMQQP
jgi:sigma-E factor negative regulatory protein RseC